MLPISFLLLMSIGVPAAIAMAAAVLVYLFVFGDVPAVMVAHRMVAPAI
jgi:hypothetical protein